MRQELYEDDSLSVFFVIDEETDEAFVELESTATGPDLSVEDDVVVAIGGRVAELRDRDPLEVTAYLGLWEELEADTLELMIRVGDWFQQWELA